MIQCPILIPFNKAWFTQSTPQPCPSISVNSIGRPGLVASDDSTGFGCGNLISRTAELPVYCTIFKLPRCFTHWVHPKVKHVRSLSKSISRKES